MPITVRPSSRQASTSGFRSVVLPEPATPVSQRQFSAGAQRMDGGELLFREPDAGVVGFDPSDRRADRRVGEVGRAVAGGRARHFGDALLDPELLGVTDPLLAFVQAEDERGRLAVVDEATRLDQAYDRVDVVSSARGSGLD